MITIKYAPGGTQVWLVTHNGLGGAMDDSKAIEVRDDGSVYISGTSDVNPTVTVNDDYLTIKYNPQNTGIGEFNGFAAHTTLFPNPSSDRITVNISSTGIHASSGLYLFVTDLFGRKLQNGVMFNAENGNATVHCDVSHLSPGVYLTEVRDASGVLITTTRFIRH